MAEIVEWLASEEGVVAARRALGRPLRVARAELGLSQREMGERLGVSQASLARAEQGLVELPGVVRRDSMPSAPREPVARLAWVRERTAAFAAGRVRFSPSGTEGKSSKG